MASAAQEGTQGGLSLSSPNLPESTQTNNYQDQVASHESKLKALWDEHMGMVKEESIFYRKAVVLLLSWHPEVDDLHTGDEVNALEDVFRQIFHYKTVRKILTQDPGPTAQIQVNKYLSDFVYEHDDTNTLLIVYYAGHARPGESTGKLSLAGKRSLVAEDSSEYHEIVWDSAEHNIKATRGDVLVIFDCCHAGELEKNVRSSFTRRAFEYLAATSAKSTTRKPGPHSFTTALIWALKSLGGTGKSFSTQELLTKILNDAPGFPDDQYPRLSERGSACLRRIVLMPLNKDVTIQSPEIGTEEEEEGPRTDLSLRFVFNKSITQTVVTNLAVELRRVISGDDFKATTILWEGINSLSRTTYEDSAARFYAHKWLRHARRKSGVPSPIDPAPQLGSSGSACSDEGRIATPNQGGTALEPEIGQDDGRPGFKSAPGLDGEVTPSPRQTGEANSRMNVSRKKRKSTSVSESGVDSQLKNLTPQKRSRREVRGKQNTPLN